MGARRPESKNGTYVEGKRKKRFELEPGKTFFVGARPHQLLALNEQMRTHYPALAAILGYEDEHVIQRTTPSPSDLIVAAVDGPHVLITSDPHHDQDRLAQIIHDISLLRDRPLVPFRCGRDRQESQLEMIPREASTMLLDLEDNDTRLPPAFTASLFASKHRIRVIALARDIDVANGALGVHHVRQMMHVWLEPLAGRAKSLPRLLDRAFQERENPLRVEAMTPENQAALRRRRWADNFASLREAADRLIVVARSDSLRQAAEELGVKSSTFANWYSHIMKLEQPLLVKRGH